VAWVVDIREHEDFVGSIDAYECLSADNQEEYTPRSYRGDTGTGEQRLPSFR